MKRLVTASESKVVTAEGISNSNIEKMSPIIIRLICYMGTYIILLMNILLMILYCGQEIINALRRIKSIIISPAI